MKIVNSIVHLSTATLCLAASGIAGADQAGSPASADVSTGLQEIVVTANKREEKLNDVGMTIDVLGGEQLKEKQITSLQDIAQNIPGLSYANSSNGTPIYTLRGVGFIDSSMSAYPAVTTYVDEAPLSFSSLTRHSAYDLQRIEVLKGPQGTLFGSNSTGGAINYVTAKPTDTLQGEAGVTYGRFNEFDTDAFLSGPITDTLKARVATRIETMSGWQYSTSRPDDTNGHVHNYMGRLLLAYEPESAVRINLDVNGWKDNSQTQAAQLVGLNFQLPIHDPYLDTHPFAPPNARAADWGSMPTSTWATGLPDFHPSADNSLWQASLRADFDLSASLTLTSLTSYVQYTEDQDNDGDGVPISVADVASKGGINDFYQELRLNNGSAGRARWVIGANFEKSDVTQIADFAYSGTSTANTYDAAAGLHLNSDQFSNHQHMRTAAGFANLEFDITRQLTFTAGGRYTDSHIDAALCTSDITGDPLGTGPTLYFVQGRPMASYVTGTCFSYNDLPYTVNGVPPGGAGEYKDTLDEDNVSWRTGLNFKPYDGLLIYGNASKGYKQGGFASISASVFSQYLPVTQESVLAYEAGFKAAFLDGKLEADGAAFYYDYDNKQLRTKINPPLFGIQDALRNIPKSSIRGFELGLSGRPVAPLTFGAAFTYLDAKIDEFTGFIYTDAAGNPIITNFAGTRMPFTSKYQFNLNGNYEANLNSTLKGFIGASVSYRSDTVAAIGGDADPPGLISPYQNIFRIASYTLVDAQFGVKAANDKWTASIFGKNLFDKYYWNNVISANDIIARYTGMPATYGVTFSIRL